MLFPSLSILRVCDNNNFVGGCNCLFYMLMMKTSGYTQLHSCTILDNVNCTRISQRDDSVSIAEGCSHSSTDIDRLYIPYVCESRNLSLGSTLVKSDPRYLDVMIGGSTGATTVIISTLPM